MHLYRTPKKYLSLLAGIFAISVLSTVHAQIESKATLAGVGYQNEGGRSGIGGLSMAGGAKIVIEGSFMATNPGMNLITMTELWNFNHLPILAPSLSENDEFNSNSMAGVLGYTTPSLMTLFGKEWDDFNGQSFPNGYEQAFGMRFTMLNAEDSYELSCGGDINNCRVTYSRDYTPLLYDVTPSNVYFGQYVQFHVNPKVVNHAGNCPAGQYAIKNMKIGNYNIDTEYFQPVEYRMNNWVRNGVDGYVGNQYPGNSEPSILFRQGYAVTLDSATHCNYAGDDCWRVKTVPMIYTVSATEGYTNGGQLMTITGHGLNGTDAVVTIDGVACQVVSNTDKIIKCVTGAKSSESSIGHSRPGSPGMRVDLVNPEDSNTYVGWNTIASGQHPTTNTTLYTTFEGYANNNEDRYGELFHGWFTAPATANYRFYTSADDAARVYMDTTNAYDGEDPVEAAMDLICYDEVNVGWRNYAVPNVGQISEWIALEEGKSYKMQGQHIDHGGYEHFTVSVEIDAVPENHPLATRQIQILKIDQTKTFEEWSFTITNPDSGTFKLSLLDPTRNPPSYYQTNAISASASADQVRSGIYHYLRHRIGTEFTVVKTLFDDQNVETESAEAAVMAKYTITLKKLISGTSANAIMAAPLTTTSSISVTPPLAGIQSSPPLSGKYTLSCTDPEGLVWTTDPLNWSASDVDVTNQIDHKIPFLANKVRVTWGRLFDYKENGISWNLIFQGLNYAPELCSIQADSDEPIVGIDPTFQVEVTRNFGETIMMEPVPLEFLSTDATSPQVLVSVNGINAVCPDFNCDYQYVSTEAVIETTTLSGSELTLTGTALPTIVEITFGTVLCSVTSSSDTEVVCILENTPLAGSWQAQVRSIFGIVPNNAAEINSGLTVDSVSPNTDVNYLGGDQLTIAGSGFGMDASKVTVTFDDGSACVVNSVSHSSIVCTNQAFTTVSQTPQTMTILVNSISDTSLIVTQKASIPNMAGLVPNSVSPVLKTEIVLTLPGSYEGTVSVDEFIVELLDDNDPEFLKELYIMSADESAMTLTVKFPGAWSGDYRLRATSATVGRLDNTDLGLTVKSEVTRISPSAGSLYGGTLITIDGYNFSDNPQDNPVKVGDVYCIIQTTSATQITCRVEDSVEISGSAKLIVFLKTSEEAVCEGTTCDFQFQTPTHTVTSIESNFDTVSLTTKAVVTGTGLSESAELWIDGEEMTLDSITDTEAIFTITYIEATESSDVQVYFADGNSEEAATYSISVIPSLLTVSPSTGSAGGTLIHVTGSGFGPETAGLNLIRTSSSSNLCETVTITGYGEFDCLTVTGDVADNDLLNLVSSSGQISPVDPANVVYSQSETMTVTGVELVANSIVFTGTGFPTSGYIASGAYNSVSATTFTVESATQATLIFSEGGVPIGSELAATIWFISELDSSILYPTMADTILLTVELIIDSSTADLTCSFNGGCAYTVSGSGVYASLQQEGNSIEVCGNTCELSSTLSSASGAVCLLPTLITSYSLENFQVTVPHVLSGSMFPAENNEDLIDYVLTVDHEDSASSNCEFGMTFMTGYEAVLDEAKVFVTNLVDKTPFVTNLVFQGSNDAWSTSNDIYTFGIEVHEGWNYIRFNDEELEKPSYNSYRFLGAIAGSCRVSEFRLTGVEVMANDDATSQCTPKLTIGESTQELTPVTYSSTVTATLTSISPRFGSVLGGTTVTLTGTKFPAGTATVSFDNRDCAVQSQSETEVVCITSDKPYIPDTPKLQIDFEGAGYAATGANIFRYVSLWSDPETWGGDTPPLEGESIQIPTGQQLLVDVDSTPVLNALIVEGALIFAPDSDPNHLRTFDANYIMVHHGYFEAGTEEYPYTSKLQITMHSTVESPYLPIYGNKVIGVRFGVIEMHGIVRPITWTKLAATVNAGATEITLVEDTDWVVGEKIAIATTSFDNHESEVRYITAKSGNTYTLDSPLEFRHISEVQTYGDYEMPMQGEVALLTRNIVYRGETETSKAGQYGAHIMIHSPGDESSIGRIEYVELTDVGQAFKLGRYPLHYHMIGTVHNSYVRGNAIYHTYNRAVTIHGVHYFRIINNVAFDTMGHTYFVEDAAETKNYLNGNIAIQVKSSFSLLGTDQTPGGMWITHPDNIILNNVVAGSDAYGFWYDMFETAVGPSYDPNVCPIGAKLGEFSGNEAHSVKKYGLRIHHFHLPREDPCSPLEYDSTRPDDPYHSNHPITAVYENFIGWAAGRCAAITEESGAMEFKNMRTADSKVANIEWSLVNVAEGYCKISDCLSVGNSGLNDVDGELTNETLHGLITSRSENLTVSNITFYNFDFKTSAAFGQCSHCWHDAATDSGARTVTFNNIFIDEATVPRKIKWQKPYKGIFFDQDGTLTGQGPNSWAMPYWHHLDQPECTVDLDVYNGIVCPNTVQVRRIAFYGYDSTVFDMQNFKVARWDDDIVADLKADPEALETFLLDEGWEHFSRIPFKDIKLPTNGWAVPFITNHKYRINWGDGLDFKQMKIWVSERWEPTDYPVSFVMNFTDVREAVTFTSAYGGENGVVYENGTLLDTPLADQKSGMNVVYNDTETREVHFVINGKAENQDEREFLMEGIQCIGGCGVDVATVEISDEFLYWSDASNWPGETLPVEGDDVEIVAGWNMILDLEETPVFNMITINGRLSFSNNETNPIDINLQAYQIFVQAGELLVGTEEMPFVQNAKITLHGTATGATLAMTGALEAGNKLLANTGLISMHGEGRSRWSRLRAVAEKGDTSALVEPFLDWKAGDRVYLAPTAMQFQHSDYMDIESYNNGTGEVTFTDRLQFYHWGQSSSTGDDYNGLDQRGEVILLTRNVKIVGTNEDKWGANILTSEFMQGDGTLRSGQLILDQVELYNCSQRNTLKAAIRFEGSNTKEQLISNTVVHEGWGLQMYISSSSKVTVSNSSFVGAEKFGINIVSSQFITLDGNFVGDVKKRINEGAHLIDKEAGYSICSSIEHNKCGDLTITNNIAAGVYFAGFVAPGHNCGEAETQTNFRGNVAHSVEGSGGHIFPDPNISAHKSTCYAGSHFSAYKCTINSLATAYSSKEVQMTDMTFVDVQKGMAIQTAVNADYKAILIERVMFYGETKAEDCPRNHDCYCYDKFAFMMSGGLTNQKELHPTEEDNKPVYKVKSYGLWYQDQKVNSVEFIKFKSGKTACGARQSVFQRNTEGSDAISQVKLRSTKFIDVVDDAVFYMEPPPQAWANKDDCGNWPCTAPNNTLLTFEKTTFKGVQFSGATSDFQIIPNTPGASETFSNCKFKEYWNGWLCKNGLMGQLIFESLDGDTEDRLISPIYLSNDEHEYKNPLNTMMDHMWDGFYTGQVRLSRFNGLVQADRDITLTTTGTQPGNLRFFLDAQKGGMKVAIPYFNAGNYAIQIEGKVIEPTEWDDAIGGRKPLPKFRCGENRYIGMVNILEFYLTPGCTVHVKPVDSIQSAVRLDWTMDEFYGGGGVTSFTDRVAAVLGIHASQIKVVAVYEGSVIIEYAVEAAEDEPDSTAALANIKSQISTLVAEKSDAFGAPVLGAITDGELTDFSIEGGDGGAEMEDEEMAAIFSEDPIIIQEQIIITEERIIKKQLEAEGGSLKFIIVGGIIFVVASIGVVAVIISMCKREKMRYSNRSREQIFNDIGAQSEQEMGPQFHPNELDIFSGVSKAKKNDDMLNGTQTGFTAGIKEGKKKKIVLRPAISETTRKLK